MSTLLSTKIWNKHPAPSPGQDLNINTCFQFSLLTCLKWTEKLPSWISTPVLPKIWISTLGTTYLKIYNIIPWNIYFLPFIFIYTSHHCWISCNLACSGAFRLLFYNLIFWTTIVVAPTKATGWYLLTLLIKRITIYFSWSLLVW